ncbi:nucleic acid/nucleotide deaminase domain-containing protein [Streptomyces sp. NPDC047315]|uniref:WXG100-like domain-containing protein n=1 Tax=Streptomyces sp. NPDC047315 TaxID=3155142 RepID=UPI0033F73644
MPVQLPEDVRDFLEYIGYDWPDINEDELRGSAAEYRAFAGQVRTTIERSSKAASPVTEGKSQGQAVDAFRKRWGKVSGHDMKNFASGLDVLANVMDAGALCVEGCKYVIIGDVAASAVTITAGVVGAFFTFGASTVLSAAAVALLRVAVKEALDYLVQQLVDLALQEIEGQLITTLTGLFDDAVSSGGVDAQGNALPVGSQAAGQVLLTDFTEFEDAIVELRKEYGRFQEQKDGFAGKRVQRSLVAKKDDRFAKFGQAIEKAEEKVAEVAGKMAKELEKNGYGLEKSKEQNKGDDKKTKDDIEDVDHRDLSPEDDIPMYLLSKDGTVQELTPQGTIKPLDKGDDSGIHALLNNGKAWRPKTDNERKSVKIKETYPGKVVSAKIDPFVDRLGQATQLARKAKGDHKWNKNYASGFYVDPKTKKPLILVGNSEQGLHSERSIGYPLINKGKEAGLKSVFTERAPCQRSSTCEKWLEKYFVKKNSNLRVTHAADYVSGDPDGNKKRMEKYIEALKKNHGVK